MNKNLEVALVCVCVSVYSVDELHNAIEASIAIEIALARADKLSKNCERTQSQRA